MRSTTSELELNCDFNRIVSIRGILVPVFDFFTSKISTQIINRSYEEIEASIVSRVIENNERVLELGVGIGFISTLILKNPNIDSYVGFEGNPELLPAIEWVWGLNDVEGQVVNAVLDHDTKSKFTNFFCRDDFWASSLSATPRPYREIIKVKKFSANTVLKGFVPTLIVCDIEGGELEFMRGADLSGVRKILLEIHRQVIGEDGVKSLFRVLEDKGFLPDYHFSKETVVLFRNCQN